jgi:hypothetical protein
MRKENAPISYLIAPVICTHDWYPDLVLSKSPVTPVHDEGEYMSREGCMTIREIGARHDGGAVGCRVMFLCTVRS